MKQYFEFVFLYNKAENIKIYVIATSENEAVQSLFYVVDDINELILIQTNPINI